MADRTMLSLEADEEVTAQVAEALDEGRHGSLGDYLRDLIRKDREEAFDLRHIDMLREAFATPASAFVRVTAEDVIERGRVRRGG